MAAGAARHDQRSAVRPRERVASLALGYPDAGWHRTLPLLTAAAGTLAAAGNAPMNRFLAAVAGQDPTRLQQAYVDPFDLRRRCCPRPRRGTCGVRWSWPVPGRRPRKSGSSRSPRPSTWEATGERPRLRTARGDARGRAFNHRPGQPARPPVRLPADRGTVLPQYLLRPPGRGPDRRGTGRLPDPRDARLGAVRRVAVHPPGTRVQRTSRIPHPALHRLPFAGGTGTTRPAMRGWEPVRRPGQ